MQSNSPSSMAKTQHNFAFQRNQGNTLKKQSTNEASDYKTLDTQSKTFYSQMPLPGKAIKLHPMTDKVSESKGGPSEFSDARANGIIIEGEMPPFGIKKHSLNMTMNVQGKWKGM